MVNNGLRFIGNVLHGLQSHLRNGAKLDIMEHIALNLMIDQLNEAYLKMDDTYNGHEQELAELKVSFSDTPVRSIEIDRDSLAQMLMTARHQSNYGDKIVLSQFADHTSLFIERKGEAKEILSLPIIF